MVRSLGAVLGASPDSRSEMPELSGSLRARVVPGTAMKRADVVAWAAILGSRGGRAGKGAAKLRRVSTERCVCGHWKFHHKLTEGHFVCRRRRCDCVAFRFSEGAPEAV